MTPDDGIDRLVFHAEPTPGGFFDMLRPFRGVKEHVLNDIMTALGASAPVLGSETVPQRLVSALWAISYLGRSWALDPNGMLRRNALITDADMRKLAAFLDRFERAVMTLLDGSSVTDAFADDDPLGP
jgi:hypothetical protein